MGTAGRLPGSRPVALVTGGSRGIGRGIALALGGAGYDVVISYVRRPDAAAEVTAALAQMGVRGLALRSDIASAADRSSLLRQLLVECGRLDVLVNNAGVAPEQRVDLLEAGEDSFDRMVSINLKGPYFLTQQAARWMIEQVAADPTRTPRIVNISSVSAYASSPARGDYCITKAGVAMMTRIFADRLARYGIGVYEIRPGITATDMTAGVQHDYTEFIAGGGIPLPRWGTPDDVGKAVAAIGLGLLPYSTGEVINVDGGFHLHRL